MKIGQLELSDRMFKISEREPFITVKIIKITFLITPNAILEKLLEDAINWARNLVRLNNPTKSELGRVTKIITERINN